jgi:DNA-binding response OmpR family regulator
MAVGGDHLLIVDSDPAFLATARDAARVLGLTVEAHPTAEAVIDRFERMPDSERLRYAVAVLEIALPKTNGVECAWRLRNLAPPLVIAIASRDLGIWGVDELRDFGVNRVLAKPVDRRDFEKWLAGLVGSDDAKRNDADLHEYQRLAAEFSREKAFPYARVLDEHRVVLYENGAIVRDFGESVGRSHTCFALLGGEAYCERCVVLDALETGEERAKKVELASGMRYSVLAVPVTASGGKRLVVELARELQR